MRKKISGLSGGATLLLAMLLLSPISSFALDSICATVKIEVSQELTLERQAFDARMRITDGVTTLPIENVDVDVSVTDELGNPAEITTDPNNTTALFFIRLDSMQNISNVDGAGVVSPGTTAEIHWLLIPARGAAKGQAAGAYYSVGATLSYTLAGESHNTTVIPDSIHVKPLPSLAVDYFIPYDVYADDPFTTDIIEPAIPFTLGLRVKNNGPGQATGLGSQSARRNTRPGTD